MLTKNEIHLIIRYLYPYRFQIGKISILAVICAIFEAVNLSALVPLLQLLNTSTPPGGTLWDILSSLFNWIGLELNFLNLLLVMGVVFLIGQCVLYIKKQMQADLWFACSANLKNQVFGNLLTVDISYHYSEKTGKFIDILNRQIEYASTTIFSVTEILTYVLFIIIYLLILLYISIPLTALCLIIAVACMYLLNFLIKKSKLIGIRANNTNIIMNEFITERLSLIKLIKIFSTENTEMIKLKNITDMYIHASTDFWMNGVKIETTFQIIIFSLALVILYTAAIILSLPLAVLLVFIFILIRLTDPLRQINAKRHDLGGQIATLEKIDQTLNESATQKTIKSGTIKFETINDQMALDHLCFSYTPSIPVIRDISFTIHKNEMVALVGASGGGKSTLVDLITRLIEPDTGTISIDNHDIKTFDIQEYHKKLGFVSQDSFIFNDTILNNIWYGSEELSFERAIEASTNANAHNFIMQLPDGYNTELGERGVKLSGGQKQRISLARALYKKPEILILDEATSALDSESEKVIQESILTLKNRYTIIIIAHRLSTIENADKILVIEKGKVTECGVHKDLINAGGTYAKYYHIQYKSSHGVEQKR